MSSINAQIDAAVVLMKQRAAEFDETKTMIDEAGRLRRDCEPAALMHRAFMHIARARTIDDLHGRVFPANARTDILDGMNLCALALVAMLGGSKEMTTCPHCGEEAFSGSGKRSINEHRLPGGMSISTTVWDDPPRGPKLIQSSRISEYWVCQSCGHDWLVNS